MDVPRLASSAAESAPPGQQVGGRGAVERLGGEQRQGLAQGTEGQAEKLPCALAGDAELEADVAQFGFVAGQGGGGIVQAVAQADGVGEARRKEEAQPFGEIQRRRLAIGRRGGVGGDAREQGAVVRVELGAGRQRRAQIAQSRATARPQHGQDARRQAAGRQGAVAKSVRARKWSAPRGHRFGPVDEASSASYSAAVSSFFSSTSSLRVWPVARPSFTSWATRS